MFWLYLLYDFIRARRAYKWFKESKKIVGWARRKSIQMELVGEKARNVTFQSDIQRARKNLVDTNVFSKKTAQYGENMEKYVFKRVADRSKKDKRISKNWERNYSIRYAAIDIAKRDFGIHIGKDILSSQLERLQAILNRFNPMQILTNEPIIRELMGIYNSLAQEQPFREFATHWIKNTNTYKFGKQYQQIGKNIMELKGDEPFSPKGGMQGRSETLEWNKGAFIPLSSTWVKMGAFIPIMQLESGGVWGILEVMTKTSPKVYVWPHVNSQVWEAMIQTEGRDGFGAGSVLHGAHLLTHGGMTTFNKQTKQSNKRLSQKGTKILSPIKPQKPIKFSK